MHTQNKPKNPSYSSNKSGKKPFTEGISSREKWRHQQEPLVHLGEGEQKALRQRRVEATTPETTNPKTGHAFGSDYTRLTFREGDLIPDRKPNSREAQLEPHTVSHPRLTGLPLGLTGADYNLSLGGTSRGPLLPIPGASSVLPPSLLGSNAWKNTSLGRDGTLNLNTTLGRGDRAQMLLSEEEEEGAKSAPVGSTPLDGTLNQTFDRRNGIQSLKEMMKNSTFGMDSMGGGGGGGEKELFSSSAASKSLFNTSIGTSANPNNGDFHASPQMQSVLSQLYTSGDSSKAIPSFESWSKAGASTTASLRYGTLTVNDVVERFGESAILSAREDLSSCFSFLSVPSSWDLLSMTEYHNDIDSYAAHLHVPSSREEGVKGEKKGREFPIPIPREKKADVLFKKSGNDFLQSAVKANERLLKAFVSAKPEMERLCNKVRQWSDRCVVETVERVDDTQGFTYTAFVEDPQEAHEIALLETLKEEEEVRTRKVISRRRLEQVIQNKRGSSVPVPGRISFVRKSTTFSTEDLDPAGVEAEESGKTLVNGVSKAVPHRTFQAQFNTFGEPGTEYNRMQAHFDTSQSSHSTKGIVSVIPLDGGRREGSTSQRNTSFGPNSKSTTGVTVTETEKGLFDYVVLTVLTRCGLNSLMSFKEKESMEAEFASVAVSGYNHPNFPTLLKDLLNLRAIQQVLLEKEKHTDLEKKRPTAVLPLCIKLKTIRPMSLKMEFKDTLEVVVDALDLILRFPSVILRSLKEIQRNPKGPFLSSASVPDSVLFTWRDILIELLYRQCPGFSPTDVHLPEIISFRIAYEEVISASEWRGQRLKDITNEHYKRDILPVLEGVADPPSSKVTDQGSESKGPPFIGCVPVVPGKRELFECDMQNLYISSSLAAEELEDTLKVRLSKVRKAYEEAVQEMNILSSDDGEKIKKHVRSVSFAKEDATKRGASDATAGLSLNIKGWKTIVTMLDSEVEYAQIVSIVSTDQLWIHRYNRLVEPYNRFQQVQKSLWGPLYKSALRISYLLCQYLHSQGLELLPEEYIPLLHPVSQFVGCTGGHREMRIKLPEVLLDIQERAKKVRLPVESVLFDGKGKSILDDAAHAATVCEGGASDVVSCLATELDVLGLALEKIEVPDVTQLNIKPLTTVEANQPLNPSSD